MPVKILIVDDDLETLRLVGIMLQRQGYGIAAASSGAQALQLAKSERPDLVVLDLMMPEMDGYEVARQLRADRDLGQIPILMFTARTQVEDKVTGYEAGADDYLTKPTHPAELASRIKALLSRAARARQAAPPPEKGYVIAVLGARGGAGTSTVALNLAVTLAQKYGLAVNAAELRPGNGTWGLELGYANPGGLRDLLQAAPGEITRDAVEREVLCHATGVRLLLSSCQPRETDLLQSTAQFEAIVTQLAFTAPITILDIGANQLPAAERVLSQCSEVIFVLNPHPAAVSRARIVLEDLSGMGFGTAKLLSVVLVNRSLSDLQLSLSEVEESISRTVAVLIPPAPELAFQAANHLTPMAMLQPEGLPNQAYGKLAELVARHAQKA